MAIPLLDSLDLHHKDITADALLTQRKLADYLVDKRQAHFHFIVKGNHPSLLDDLVLFFNDRKQPDFKRLDPPNHGRIETRKIWTSTELNGYLDFPHVAHWSIENSCHYILDWNFDEDRCRIRTGYGPENVTRLRRFAIGLIKSQGAKNVAQKMRQLNKNTRLVFDYLRMTANSCAARST